MPVPPVNALRTHQPLDFIRLIHCHEGRVALPPDFAKCGGSRREVERAAKMAAVPVRVWTLPKWWLSQSESRRDVLFRAR